MLKLGVSVAVAALLLVTAAAPALSVRAADDPRFFSQTKYRAAESTLRAKRTRGGRRRR